MNRGRKIAGVLLAMAVLGLNAAAGYAADANNKYKLRGMGALTCGKYLEERRTDIKGTSKYADWMTGYLTAYNFLQPQTYDIAPNHNATALLTYFDLYCSKNQNHLIGQAAAEFVKAVYNKRQISG